MTRPADRWLATKRRTAGGLLALAAAASITACGSTGIDVGGESHFVACESDRNCPPRFPVCVRNLCQPASVSGKSPHGAVGGGGSLSSSTGALAGVGSGAGGASTGAGGAVVGCPGADLTRDPSNCGACGRACGPVVLASGPHLSAFAIDSTSAYWTNLDRAGMSCTQCNGTVMKIPLDGGTPVALAAGQASPAGIAVGASDLVWANAGDGTGNGTMMRMPLRGGAAVALVSNPSPLIPTTLAVDGTSIYWTNQGNAGTPCTRPCGVMRMPLGGGNPVNLAPGMFGAVDATSIYWAGDNGLMRMPLGGGNSMILLSGAPADPVPFAVDATTLYWAGIHTLWSAPLTGGQFYGNSARISPLGPELDRTSHLIPTSIAVDATSVYWTDAKQLVIGLNPVI